MDDSDDFGVISSTASLEQLVLKHHEQGLRIPPYQRGYEWNARNIQRFVDTLLEEFKKSHGGKNPIFLGPIQISKEGQEEDRVTQSIVDGRQRLTTLALLEAFLIHQGESKPERLVSSLLSKQDDPQLASTIEALTEGKIEAYPTLDAQTPSVLRLTNKGKKASEDDYRDRGVYIRNARFIVTILKDKKDEAKGLLEYIRRNVFFVVVTVEGRDLTSIIKIFDSMNSTGQPLSDDAMFKLRLYAHVRSNGDAREPSEIIQHINGTYKLVEDYNKAHEERIVMADVLWGFRLFCVAMKKQIIHEWESVDEIKEDTFLMPTLQFFEMLFSLPRAEVTLELFRQYTEAHIDFYAQTYGDTSWGQDGDKAFYYSLLDYFLYTRYPSFWALPVVCFAIKQQDVLTALKTCGPVFQACLAWSICYERANKPFKTKFLYDALDRLYTGDSVQALSKERIGKIDAGRHFWDEVEKDIYESYRQTYLLLAILGMQDEMAAGNTFGGALSLYFKSSGDNRLQIEHIYAKKEWEKITDGELRSRLNGLGNLVPLEAKINQGSNKAGRPSDKFAEGKFFNKSTTVQSVKNLVKQYKDVNATCPDLDDPGVWNQQIVKPRFASAKEKLIGLMNLIEFGD